MKGNEETKTTKKKNSAIEIWRFFFAIAIVGYHIGVIFPMAYIPDLMTASNWMAGAGEVLFVFTLTSGYFMMSHFKRKQEDKEYAKRSAGSRAWEYFWGRVKGLLPVLILGIVLGIAAYAFYYSASFTDILDNVLNGLWEFLGFYSLGFTAAFGQSNGALWFISALIICSFILYFLLCYKEDLTTGLLVPFIFFFFEGWWCKTGIRASQAAFSTIGGNFYPSASSVSGSSSTAGMLGFNNGLLFVLVGLCGGILLYFAVRKLREKKFSIFYLVCAVLLVVYTINPTIMGDISLDRMTVHLLCIIVVGLTLLEKDFISEWLNNKTTSKLFNYLGSLSLYIYMLHIPIVYLLVKLFNQASYSWASIFWPVTIISIALSILTKFLMDELVFKR